MKEKTGKLLAKAQDAIESAEILHRAGKQEGAAGRAYYAMFYIAEALLFERGFEFSKHAGVHAAFGEHFAKTGVMDATYHRWLLDGFRVRISGDYGVDVSIDATVVEEMIARSYQFLDAARSLV